MTAAVPVPRSWDLVERAQAGDRDAMADIYRANYDRVFAFVYFRTGNRQVAEDLTGDTFLRALKRIGSVSWQGHEISAWLFTIARNLIADHFKSHRFKRERLTGDMISDADVTGVATDPDADPEDTAIDSVDGSRELARIRSVVRPALADLTFEQKLAVELRFLDGLSVKETAEAMRMTEGAVKAITYRAMENLRRDERVRALVAA